jgi:hypothetical protein
MERRCECQVTEVSEVLHLRWIGGIGKSALLNHWTSTIGSSIRYYTPIFTHLSPDFMLYLYDFNDFKPN